MRPSSLPLFLVVAAARSGLPAPGRARPCAAILPQRFAAIATARTGTAGPPAPVPTTLDAVLLRVADSLVAAGIVGGPERAIVSLDAEPYPSAGGPQCVVSPGDFAARESHQAGTGRALATEDGGFTVHVADECALDLGGQDRVRLLAPDAGRANLLRVAHAVRDRLHGRFVVDLAGNLLSLEPVLFRGATRPRRYAADPTWAGVDLAFSLTYAAALGGAADLDLDGA